MIFPPRKIFCGISHCVHNREGSRKRTFCPHRRYFDEVYSNASKEMYIGFCYCMCNQQGNFSTKSDVWSFAVTLWEILTFARERPFDALTDEQVVENCACCYHEDGRDAAVPDPGLERVVLGQPANCPREIYDLMVECWNRDASQRPSFREVHMFLQRKNMGYSAADERRTPSRSIVQCV